MLLAQWQGGNLEFILPESQRTVDGVVNPKPGWS